MRLCCRDVSGEIKTPVDWMAMPFTFEPGALVGPVAVLVLGARAITL